MESFCGGLLKEDGLEELMLFVFDGAGVGDSGGASV